VVPVQGDEQLPDRVDVVVIGAGIIGASTALELAERGLSVALCEKGGVGHEQSSRNWGWVRISRRDPRELPLMAHALQLWDGLAARIGKDVGYTRAGILFTCADEQSYAEHERWKRNLEDYPVSAQMLSGTELNRLLPEVNRLQVKGALYTPDDGRAEPQQAAPAIAEAARAKGAYLFTECAVRGIERSAGRVSGVITERGPIACSSVVLAGGAWSSLFCSPLSVHLPQLKVLNSVIRTTPLEGGPQSAIWTSEFAIRKRQDGGYTLASGHENIADIVPDSFRYARQFWPAFKHEHASLSLRLGQRFFQEAVLPRRWALDEASPFEYRRVLDPLPSIRQSDRALANLIKAFPMFSNVGVAQRWGGMIDVTPDAVPVISAVDAVPGFFIATGFSGHGFGIGPAAGRLMANLVTGETPIVDTKAFSLSRFSDGSTPMPISGF
jgi:glycine/D-amino acid oxidase-like deaminating enzyme